MCKRRSVNVLMGEYLPVMWAHRRVDSRVSRDAVQLGHSCGELDSSSFLGRLHAVHSLTSRPFLG